MNTENLTKAIEELALSEGAHLIGFGPVERYEKLPKKCGPRPQDVYPGAKTVIAMAVRLPDACMERAAVHDYNDPEAGAINVMGSLRGNMISARISRLLNQEGYGAFPISATIMWRYRPYKDYDAPFIADISHRHMAAGAGLGEFGWNGLFMAPGIGPRCRLATVLTDAELTPTPMYDGEPLCDKCMRCVRSCGKHLQCLTKDVNGKVSIELGGKTFEYANKNLWRCAWTENFAIRDDAPKPDAINEATMTEVFRDLYLNDHMDRYQSWTVEPCWGECLPPSEREMDPDFCDVPKRKKEKLPDDGKIRKMAADYAKKRFSRAQVAFINLNEHEQLKKSVRFYLPNANAVVAMKIDVPTTYREIATHLWQEIISFELDMASGIDALGYSSIQLSFLRNRKTSQGRVAGMKLTKVDEADLEGLILGETLLKGLINTFDLVPGGIAEDDDEAQTGKLYEGILTSQDFLEGQSRIAFIATEAELERQTFQVTWDENGSSDVSSESIKVLSRELGLDLVGVSSVSRLDEVSAQLRDLYADSFRLECRDRNPGKGPVDPDIRTKAFAIPTAQDYLPNAKSVIVIGLEVFKPILDVDHRTPSEGLVAYATHKGFTLDLLADAAYRVCEALSVKGVTACPVFDFMKTASVTPFPIREYRHDNFSSRFAAVAAGLGELGAHGMLMTKEFGVRQMCMSIVIDRELEPDPLYNGKTLCRGCGKCISACPAYAFGRDANTIEIEGTTFSFNTHDHNKCDWAKKYGLLGDEGPKYTGSITDVPTPETVTAANLAEAMKSLDQIQKDYFLVQEPCLIACAQSGVR